MMIGDFTLPVLSQAFYNLSRDIFLFVPISSALGGVWVNRWALVIAFQPCAWDSNAYRQMRCACTEGRNWFTTVRKRYSGT